MSKKSELEARRAEAIVDLRKLLPPGTEVITLLRHVSKSGMSRRIDFYTIKNNKMLCLTGLVATVLDLKFGAGEGVVVGGCGMDMGFGTVYNLSHALYPKGFGCIGEHCRSNDHSNGDRSREWHNHSDGGYALRQRWL